MGMVQLFDIFFMNFIRFHYKFMTKTILYSLLLCISDGIHHNKFFYLRG